MASVLLRRLPGHLGRVSRLVEEAACIAILAGRNRIDAVHLSGACRDWAMFFKLTDWDPWADGHKPRDVKTILKAAEKDFPI